MGIFKSRQGKDLQIGDRFSKRFKKAIIGKDKKTGFLVMMFKSKSEAVFTIKTAQKEPQVFTRQKNGA